MQKDGEERTVGLETILEIESNQELRQPWRFEPGPTVKPLRSWNSGLYAFVAMLMGGLAFLWIYSRLPQTLSLQSFATMQQAISRSAFEDWQKVALIALSAFAIALVARHSRDSVPTHLLSTN